MRLCFFLSAPASETIKEALALTVGFGSTFAIVGYLYGVPLLYGSVRYTAMAVHTGLGLVLLSLGYLHIESPHGFVRIFRSPKAGGVIVRRLVPPAILVPIALGAIFSRVNFGQLKLGIVFIVLSNMLLIVTALCSLAWALDKSDVKRGLAQHDSEIDALTGIHNRRYFDIRLREEIQRCVRHSRHFCLLMFDIDKFKSVNDRFSHLSGDEVLRSIAHACETNLRVTDIICRYGGEEFAIIAPETTGLEGMVLARKVRHFVAGLHFAKVPAPVTVSLGVIQIGGVIATSELAIAAADVALYEAKHLGRNRECLHASAEQIRLEIAH